MNASDVEFHIGALLPEHLHRDFTRLLDVAPGDTMKPYTLLIERTRIERASVVVLAGSRGEAERLGHEKAAADEVLWEESERELSVSAEAPCPR